MERSGVWIDTTHRAHEKEISRWYFVHSVKEIVRKTFFFFRQEGCVFLVVGRKRKRYPPRPMLWLVETYNPLRLWCAITYPIRSAMAFAHKSDYKVAVLGGGGV
jgi:hypothetical protein